MHQLKKKASKKEKNEKVQAKTKQTKRVNTLKSKAGTFYGCYHGGREAGKGANTFPVPWLPWSQEGLAAESWKLELVVPSPTLSLYGEEVPMFWIYLDVETEKTWFEISQTIYWRDWCHPPTRKQPRDYGRRHLLRTHFRWQQALGLELAERSLKNHWKKTTLKINTTTKRDNCCERQRAATILWQASKIFWTRNVFGQRKDFLKYACFRHVYELQIRVYFFAELFGKCFFVTSNGNCFVGARTTDQSSFIR